MFNNFETSLAGLSHTKRKKENIFDIIHLDTHVIGPNTCLQKWNSVNLPWYYCRAPSGRGEKMLTFSLNVSFGRDIQEAILKPWFCFCVSFFFLIHPHEFFFCCFTNFIVMECCTHVRQCPWRERIGERGGGFEAT